MNQAILLTYFVATITGGPDTIVLRMLDKSKFILFFVYYDQNTVIFHKQKNVPFFAIFIYRQKSMLNSTNIYFIALKKIC